MKSGRLNGMDALLINCTLSNLTLVTAASSHLSHCDAVILRRLRVAHTRVTHHSLRGISATAQHCCKGDERFQWEMPFFRVFQLRNP